MANITLFAQAIGRLPKEIIRKIIREEKTDKHSKGYDTWSQFISMMFCQFSGCDSVRDISNGLNSANGNLNHLGICRAPSKSTVAYQNAKRGQWRVPTDILCTACSFWTAGGMATHQVPFQDANQITGFIYHHADHVALRMGTLHNKERGR